MELKGPRSDANKDLELFLVLSSIMESVYCCRSQDRFWVLVVFVVVVLGFGCVLVQLQGFHEK